MTEPKSQEMSADNATSIIVAGIQTGQLKFPFGNRVNEEFVRRFIEERTCKDPSLDRIHDLCEIWKYDEAIKQIARADAAYFRELFFALMKKES